MRTAGCPGWRQAAGAFTGMATPIGTRWPRYTSPERISRTCSRTAAASCQINRYPDREPYIFEFNYEIRGNAIVQTENRRSDGTWTRYTFNDKRYTTSETRGTGDTAWARFTFERDPGTNRMTALTLTCPDRSGLPLRHTSLVRSVDEEAVKGFHQAALLPSPPAFAWSGLEIVVRRGVTPYSKLKLGERYYASATHTGPCDACALTHMGVRLHGLSLGQTTRTLSRGTLAGGAAES